MDSSRRGAIWFFFLLPHLYLISSSLSCLPDHEKALLRFKSKLLDNPQVSWRSGFQKWNSSSDCCNLEGVTCRGLHLSSDSPKSVVELRVGALAQGFSVADLSPIFEIRTLIRLDASYCVLHGGIPKKGLSRLSQLEHLDMSGNHLNDSIPLQIYNLTKLKQLDLSDNSLSGRLSSNIGNLRKLEVLNLENNALSGSIPPEIGKLFNLLILSLAYNGLTGAIPSSLSNLTELQKLDLSSNSLSSIIPVTIGAWQNVSELYLQRNSLSGSIPASIGKLRNLKSLHLSENFLTGFVPSSLFELKKLTALYIGNNRLSWNDSVAISPRCFFSELSLQSSGMAGEIPWWLSGQKKLQLLDLRDNELSGSIPPWLAYLGVPTLLFGRNMLTGVLPPSLFSSQLVVIDFSGNELGGELPKNIGNASSLEMLVLSGNSFHGPLPETISNLSLLWMLDLANNFFSGDILPAFKSGPSHLDLSGNHFSGPFPMSMPNANLNSLEFLDLHDNNITGALPLYLAELPSLRIVSLRGNSIAGSIPVPLSKLQHLQFLDLSCNHLTGQIPSELGSLPYLQFTHNNESYYNDFFASDSSEYYNEHLTLNWKGTIIYIRTIKINLYLSLDLSNNQLSGQIPPSLGNLRALKSLNFSFNNLTGEIPDSLGKLKVVESLSLAHNMLSGEIPRSFEELGELTTLDLSSNKLVGNIPAGGQMSTMTNPDSYANNDRLCGFQIAVDCETAAPTEDPLGSGGDWEEDQTWFSWEAMLVGYSFGFVVAVVIVSFTKVPNPWLTFQGSGRSSRALAA
ncbi:hypothetical protein HPP92_013513 [Vanilla planifolia]|uniref:Leucine-rich repeat-containing N-terminal plant-type domain-containing protein n=1 Tax=Vanilla planifolia TaxID=51239 RepID=A0A835UWT1_VANPL|nr:hypothetical protein HPP92_013513 [Vanilla planifolia]